MSAQPVIEHWYIQYVQQRRQRFAWKLDEYRQLVDDDLNVIVCSSINKYGLVESPRTEKR